MTCYVYADVILLNNFAMDFLLLNALKRLLRLDARRYGCFLASLLGAAYALLFFLYPLASWQTVLTSVGMSLLMVNMAFRLKKQEEQIRAVCGLYLFSVMAAGVLELFHRFSWFSIWWFYIAAVWFGIWGSSFLWNQVLVGAVRQRHLYQVDLWMGGKKQTVTAFLDTGNHLTEPISGEPVAVLWGGVGKELLSESEGLFCIPFHSVGKRSGLLPAVRADRMEIQQAGKRQMIEHPYIAISDIPLSQNDSYQMLLHEKMW